MKSSVLFVALLKTNFHTYTLGSTNMAGWKMDHLKMYFLLKMVIFHCYVSLLEGNS